MATLTTAEYAELAGITQRAVQKSVKKYREDEKIDAKALVAVEKIEFHGNAAKLVMERDYKRKIEKSIPDRLNKVRAKK